MARLFQRDKLGLMETKRLLSSAGVILLVVFFHSAHGVAQVSTHILHSFPVIDGKDPRDGLTLSKDGNTLFGTTQYGWDGNGQACAGTIFKIGTTGGTLTYLHAFGGSDGAFPQGLTLSSDGAVLYGVTNPGQGGWPGNGTVFQMNADGGSFAVLHTFGGSDGKYPQGSLTLSGATLYGMTPKGGANGTGAIFAVTSPTVIDLVSFTATPSPAKVTLDWQTSAEIDTVRFYLSRSPAREGPFARITPLIPSQGFSWQGTAYRYADTDVQSGTTYYYRLGDIDGNGAVSYHPDFPYPL